MTTADPARDYVRSRALNAVATMRDALGHVLALLHAVESTPAGFSASPTFCALERARSLLGSALHAEGVELPDADADTFDFPTRAARASKNPGTVQ